MGYPHEVTFKVKLAIIQTRVFSHYFGEENIFEFGYILVEILQIYTMHNLPHRVQVMTIL